ncbi:MAG: hypothetical protein ABSB15_01960 [Bryobacteraceae bacterium]|jgi:hypothetical protein
MKTRIIRYFLTAAGIVGLAGTPALFARDYYGNSNLRHDYRRLDREIRADQWRLREDLEHGRYRQAERLGKDLYRDQLRRDRRYGWR